MQIVQRIKQATELRLFCPLFGIFVVFMFDIALNLWYNVWCKVVNFFGTSPL
ncbi:MAG: hypothetical protein LBU60_05590 [Clostridiales bacterium]|nr:hypothetical protein [Clostridiales bacterium]